MKTKDKKYIIILQCHIVKERCSGYFCEQSLFLRKGGFKEYPKDRRLRAINMTCGGCCGRASHRKISNLISKIGEKEGIDKDKIVVHMASCITKDNYHGPKCPHLGYLKELINKLDVDLVEDTYISERSKESRISGKYKK